jgi:hypothetical protein
MKKMIGLLSSLENQHKQFKANFAKHKPSASNGGAATTGTNRQPPFSNQAPTDPDEVRTWNDRNWYYCAKCKFGGGCWSPSHSTNGIPALSIDPHRGVAPLNKRSESVPDNGYKKQRTFDGTKSCQDIKAMKASFMISGGQTMAAILAARQNPGTQDEQE